MNSDPFWATQFNILYDKDRMVEFFPTSDMSKYEKLNAITRFAIYISIILYIIYRKVNIFFIAFIVMFILYIVFYNQQKEEITNQEQFETEIKNNLNIDPNTPIKVNDQGDICQKPTPNNPFMNVLMTDYTDNPNRPPACSYNDVDANKERDKYFNYNLYQDVEDVWGRRNSQREYVTLPGTTIPNDRDSFMKWCWKTTYVCKDGDLGYCLQDEDLRVPGYS